jgi:8-hydroxy-5-deazaflavin:NADPH oxidoreductase
VLALIEDLGFDAIDAGGLDDSWLQQPGTPIYTTDHNADHARAALALAQAEHTVEWRARIAAAAASS